MSLKTIFEVTSSARTAIDFLRSRNCLRKTAPLCPVCGKSMTEVQAQCNDGSIWRCPKHKGNKLSLRADSLWTRSALGLPALIQLVYMWSYELSISTTSEMTGIAPKSVLTWFSYFREVCGIWLSRNMPSEFVAKSEPAHLIEVQEVVSVDVGEGQDVVSVDLGDDDQPPAAKVVVKEEMVMAEVENKRWIPKGNLVIKGNTLIDGFVVKKELIEAIEDPNPEVARAAKHKAEVIWKRVNGGKGFKSFENFFLHVSQIYPTP